MAHFSGIRLIFLVFFVFCIQALHALDVPTPSATMGTCEGYVRITWGAIRGAKGYYVFRSSKNDISTKQVLVGSSGAYNIPTTYDTYFDDKNVRDYSVYYYWVGAVDSNGTVWLSAQKVTRGQKSSGPTLYAPLPIATKGCYSDGVLVSWDITNNEDVVSYSVWRGTDSNSSSATAIATGLPNTQDYFLDSDVTLDQTYYYWIKPVNRLNIFFSNGSLYATGYATASPSFAPEYSNLSATNNYLYKIILSWNQLPWARQTYLYRSTKSDMSDEVLLAEIPCAINTYTDQSAEAKTTYFYALDAVDKEGNRYRTMKYGPARGYLAPQEYYTPVASQGTYLDKVVLTWEKVDKAKYYLVGKKMKGEAFFDETFFDANTLQYEDTDILCGLNYIYKVTPLDENKCGCLKFPREVTGYAALPTPSSVTASKGSNIKSIFLKWEQCDGCAGYSIYRDTDPSFSDPVLIAKTNNSGLEYEDATATPGTLYYYSVATYSSEGLQFKDFVSSVDSGYVDVVPPTLEATDDTDTSCVALSWEGCVLDHYMIYRGEDTDFTRASLVHAIEDGQTTYRDIEAVPGRRYYYWLKCIGENGLEFIDYEAYAEGQRAVIYYPMTVIVGNAKQTSQRAEKETIDLSCSEELGDTIFVEWEFTPAMPMESSSSSLSFPMPSHALVAEAKYKKGVRLVLNEGWNFLALSQFLDTDGRKLLSGLDLYIGRDNSFIPAQISEIQVGETFWAYSHSQKILPLTFAENGSGESTASLQPQASGEWFSWGVHPSQSPWFSDKQIKSIFKWEDNAWKACPVPSEFVPFKGYFLMIQQD